MHTVCIQTVLFCTHCIITSVISRRVPPGWQHHKIYKNKTAQPKTETKQLYRSSPISLGCRSMLLRQPKLEEKMLSICRSSMLSAVSAC